MPRLAAQLKFLWCPVVCCCSARCLSCWGPAVPSTCVIWLKNLDLHASLPAPYRSQGPLSPHSRVLCAWGSLRLACRTNKRSSYFALVDCILFGCCSRLPRNLDRCSCLIESSRGSHVRAWKGDCDVPCAGVETSRACLDAPAQHSRRSCWHGSFCVSSLPQRQD